VDYAEDDGDEEEQRETEVKVAALSFSRLSTTAEKSVVCIDR
jgi:hypothetical protein